MIIVVSKRGTKPRIGRFFTTMLSLLTLTGITACDLTVMPDPHFVDADLNPAGLSETMVGAEVGLNYAYDVWVYNVGLFDGELVSTSEIRWEQSARQTDRNLSQSSGLTGGGRDRRGPSVGYYAWLQDAIAASNKTKKDLVAGVWPQVTDAKNSKQYAELSMFLGWEITWLSDFYCELVLYGKGPVLSSADGYALALATFNEAINATGVDAKVKTAAIAGAARVNRYLGNLSAAAALAAQVPLDFEFLANYSLNTFVETNHVWFRLWAFGEHSTAPAFRDLKIDATGVADSRMDLTKDAIPSKGLLTNIYSPTKIPAGSSPLRITSGVEMRYIQAENALADGSPYTNTVKMINEARVQRGVATAWAATGSPFVVGVDKKTALTHTAANEVRDKLIDEKRRALFLEGTQQGDNRLYLRRDNLNLYQTTIPQEQGVGDVTCRLLPQREIDQIEGLGYTKPYVYGS